MSNTFINQRRTAIRRAGFTLIEIIIAMGIFTLGIAYVMELFQRALRTTVKARQQVILAILFQDLKQKEQTAAVLAKAGGVDTFEQNIGGGWMTDMGPIGLHDYGNNWIGAKNAYNQLSPNIDEVDNETNEYVPDGKPDYYYDEIQIYRKFMFAINSVTPINKENNQFVDWDGYVATDRDGNVVVGITEQDVQEEFNGEPGFQDYGTIFDFGEPAPTAGANVQYQPQGMRHYIKRMQCIIAFDYIEDNPPNMFSPGNYDNPNYCQHEVFYFDVFNPDTDKDTTTLP